MFTFSNFRKINAAPSVEMCKILCDSWRELCVLCCMCWLCRWISFKHTHTVRRCRKVNLSKQRSHKQHSRWWRRSQVTIWLIFSVVWITFWFTFSDSFCGWTRSAKKNWEIKQKLKTSNVFIKIQHLDLLCFSIVPFGHMKFENHLFYFLQRIYLWDGTKIIWRKMKWYIPSFCRRRCCRHHHRCQNIKNRWLRARNCLLTYIIFLSFASCVGWLSFQYVVGLIVILVKM